MSDALAPTGRPESDLDRIKSLVLDSVSSEHSRRAYAKALDEFLAWARDYAPEGFTKAAVQRYRAELEGRGLAPSTINLRLSAVRKLAAEAADNRLLAPDLAAGIGRVHGVHRAGIRVGNWLSREQAEQLLGVPDASTLKGKRDRALLAVLLGAGLRRDEAASLTFEHIQMRDARWVVADLIGKGKRLRTVPIPAWTKAAVDSWARASGLASGPVFRPVNKADRLAGTSITPQAVFAAVIAAARKAGFTIAPHDLRRSFAKLAHRGRAPLEQIQLSLGHASILTTERYLGIKQNLIDAPCDHLDINFEADPEPPDEGRRGSS